MESVTSQQTAPYRIVDRYAIFDEIAAGGMATVHLGRLIGPGGFSRTVAIKRLHEHLAKDPSFVDMFLDEARLAARITHPNVVQTVDIVPFDDQLFLVMDYVQGEALSRLLRTARARNERIPLPIASAIIVGVLHGLHAAHEATNERGEPLHIVHRDVSPQNVMVGLDGIPRVLDFGIAKAVGRMHTTRDGALKGKLAYMAPEQIRKGDVSRLADVYAAAVVYWEMLTGERLFGGEQSGDNEAFVLERVLFRDVEPPSTKDATIPTALDAIVLRALSRDAGSRFPTARDMARAIEDTTKIASSSAVGEWVAEVAAEALSRRALKVSEIESVSDIRQIHPPSGPISVRRPRTEEYSETHSGPKVFGPTSTELDALPVTPSRRRSMVVAVALVIVVGMAIAAVMVGARSNKPSPATPSAAAASSLVPAPSITPTVASEIPSAEAAPTKTPAPAASASAMAGRPVPGAPKVPRAGGPALPKTTATPSKPGCTPPYVIDAAGMKQYKLECL